jgi:hypothetical protein
MKKRGGLFCCVIIQFLLVLPYGSFGKALPLSRGRITIIIEPIFNGEPLVLADQYYVDGHGDSLYIDLMRFYISQINLTFNNVISDDTNSHLVDASDPATCTFHVDNISAGAYISMQFFVGVDSVANTSGANGGDLDPAKGMYWAWNTGYIMAKMEGHSKVCKTLHHAFEFHIGGYMPPYNAVRAVNLKFPHVVTVLNGCNTIVRIKADAAAWFKSVDLSKLNDVVMPGKDANIIADNYAQMFSGE